MLDRSIVFRASSLPLHCGGLIHAAFGMERREFIALAGGRGVVHFGHRVCIACRSLGALRVRVRASPDTHLTDRKASIRIDKYAFYCFDFFGARFFGPVPVDDSASLPWQGQAFLNASMATVIPGSFTRSGLLSRYRRRILALCKMLPCAGGHARTSAGRFGEKSIAVSIIPSHVPADRASSESRNEF
jgi:hypothetical protein